MSPSDPGTNPALADTDFDGLNDNVETNTGTYVNANEDRTERIVRPVALIYHIECTMLAAWCELRNGFRHFRTDRIWACELIDDHFCGQGEPLRAIWQEQNHWDVPTGTS